jgi:ABC-2 type transport system ATP-binding protein
MTPTPAISITGLTKSYGDHTVLDGVDLTVRAGSVVALLGSNGAGKTTLVRILSTLLRADSGSAAVCGYDVASHPADVRAAISLTGQFAAIDDVLTGRENLELVAELRHFPHPGRIADDLLARFDLAEASRRRVERTPAACAGGSTSR